MFRQLIAYLQFLWKATNEHGVHSPFIFDLVTKCFYDKTIYDDYSVLERHRFNLINNNEFLSVTDFGVGSKVFKSNNRKIAEIAKTAGISKKRAALLFRIVRYLQPEYILELGTSVGLATATLSLGNPKANITSLEGCPNTMLIAKSTFSKWITTGLIPNNIHFIATEFSTYLASQSVVSKKFDLIYFDGNHQKEATICYFDYLLPTATANTVWIFDDIHWSDEMEAAWEHIKNHTKVRVTIDTFRWGLVFFRTEQAKQHFVIRV